MKTKLKGFTDFIREQGVVGLAVGLAIGAASASTVQQIVDNLINPFVAYFLSFIVPGGSSNLADYTLTFGSGDHVLLLGWGAVLDALIKLIAVAAVIYFVVMGFKLNKLDKPKEENK